MAHVRPYNSNVRVGNWFEDVALEEDKLKVYLEKKERGQLFSQRVGNFIDGSTQSINLSSSTGGHVSYGDTLCLLNPGSPSKCNAGARKGSLLSANFPFNSASPDGATTEEIEATGSCIVEPSSRNAFVIEKANGEMKDTILRYGDKFKLRLANTDLYLASDTVTFSKCTKKSRHQLVYFTTKNDCMTEWKAVSQNPQMRLEMEYQPVQANSLTLIVHSRTNVNLSVEENFTTRTLMGYEYEISCYNYYDTHKAEKECSLWVFFMPPFQNFGGSQ